MSNLKREFLKELGDAVAGSYHEEQPRSNVRDDQPQQSAESSRMDRIEAALERITAPPTVASIVNRPNPNPTSDRGSPGHTPSFESDSVPVWKWSEEKTQRFIRDHGHREFAQMAKVRLKKDLHGIRFRLPRPGER